MLYLYLLQGTRKGDTGAGTGSNAGAGARRKRRIFVEVKETEAHRFVGYVFERQGHSKEVLARTSAYPTRGRARVQADKIRYRIAEEEEWLLLTYQHWD